MTGEVKASCSSGCEQKQGSRTQVFLKLIFETYPNFLPVKKAAARLQCLDLWSVETLPRLWFSFCFYLIEQKSQNDPLQKESRQGEDILVVTPRLEEEGVMVAGVSIQKGFCIFIVDYCSICLKSQAPKP